jgi:hypothetical protein
VRDEALSLVASVKEAFPFAVLPPERRITRRIVEFPLTPASTVGYPGRHMPIWADMGRCIIIYIH